MTMRLRGLATAAIFLAAASGADAQAVIGDKPVAQDWFDYEIHWSEGAPSYVAKWLVLRDDKGTILLCGAGVHSGGLRRQNDRILEDLGFYIGEDLVMVGMDFFSDVKGRNVLEASARCISTGKNARNFEGDSVSLRSTKPRRRFRM